MKLCTRARDALHLNWAVPQASLPEPPRPLRLQTLEVDGQRCGFVSAVLFWHEAERHSLWSMLHVPHPELHLRFAVLDGEGLPGTFLWREMAPFWAQAGLWLAGRSGRSARFSYPRSLSEPGGEASWRWRVAGEGPLAVTARLGSGSAAAPFHSFDEVVAFFCRRRFYVGGRYGLERSDVSRVKGAPWPLSVEMEEDGLLRRLFGPADWPGLHSAFLCAEASLVFELAGVPEIATLAASAPKVATDPALLSRPPLARDRAA